MEKSKFFGSVTVLLILTMITFIIAVMGLSTVFSGNLFVFEAFVQFLGYLGTLLIQVIVNFSILIINGLSFMITRKFDVFPLVIMGVPNFNFFTAFYRSIFIFFLISSICFFAYFAITRNSNWSIVSFICIVIIILMAALTPIFVELFDVLFMNLALEKVFGGMIYTILQLALGIFFMVFLSIMFINFITKSVKKQISAVLFFFIVIFSVVFLNVFTQNFFPDFLYITMELSNISLSIQLKPHIYQTLLNAFYIASMLPVDLQNLIGLLIYQYYFTPITSYIISPEYLSTFFALLFLELSFQVSYFQEIYLPTRERGERLQKELEELEERFKKLKESKTVEKPEEEGEEGEEKKVVVHSISVRRFFSSEAFDYLREMMEKRKKLEAEGLKKEPEEEFLNDDEAQRLQLYVEERITQNLKAKRSLAAEAISPDMSKVLLSTAQNIIYRLITFITLTIILLFSTEIFQAIGSPQIRMSIEVRAPTVIALLLFPIILSFPVIGSVIKIRRFPKEEPKKIGVFDIFLGILGVTVGIIFIAVSSSLGLIEFMWLSIPFFVFGGFVLIFGLVQILRKSSAPQET